MILRSISFLALLSLAIGCGGRQNDFNRTASGNSTTSGNAESAKDQPSGNPANPSTPNSAITGNGDKVGDIDAGSNALQPVPIAGAFLTCFYAGNFDTLGCEVIDGEGKPTKNNQAIAMEWTMDPTNGQPEYPITTKDIIPTDIFSVYIINLKGQVKGTVKVKISNGTSTQNIAFEMKGPGVDEPVVTIASLLTDLPSANTLLARAEPEGRYFGSTPSAACSGKQTIPVKSKKIVFDLKSQLDQASFSLGGVCGLESMKVVAIVKMPSPLKPIVVTLLPGAGFQSIFSDLTLAPGNYEITIDNSFSAVGSGPVDSFVIGGFSLNGLGQDQVASRAEVSQSFQESYSE